MSEIPILDFSEYGLHVKDPRSVSQDKLRALAKDVVDIFSTTGFCYMKNHGIDEKLLQEYMRVSRGVFALPSTVKQGYIIGDEIKYGWMGPDKESLNPNLPADLKESFNYSPDEELTGWPPVDDFERMTKELFTMFATLVKRFLDVLSIGLNIPVDLLRDAHKQLGQRGNTSTLRSLYYPPIPPNSDIKPGQVRLGAHDDYGTITFLYQDDVGGLDLKRPGVGFVPATPVPGTLVVNTCCLLQQLTADRFIAAEHRVLIPEEEIRRRKYRQSIVFFTNPDSEFEVKCLDGSDKYKPIKSIDYIKYRVLKGYVEY